MSDAETTSASGRELWKSLAQRENPDPFEEFVRREYPSQIHKFMDPPERREFLKLMGASLALAGVSASCTRQPKETILPYAKSPESTIPGKPLYFATSMPWSRGAIGILVESHEGRPTKIEGNPDHPASLGATDAITQAAILGLYDPDRSKAIKYRGAIRTWDDFLTTLKQAMTAQAAKQGAGLRILTDTVTSRTLLLQLRDLLGEYPAAKWHQWDPVNRDSARDAFQDRAACQYHFDKADLVISLGADFLGEGPESTRATRDFVRKRKAGAASSPSNRLYVVEVEPTRTGAMADHRMPLKPSQFEAFADALLGYDHSLPSELEPWIATIRKELAAHPGRAIVIPGECQSSFVHYAADRLNRYFDNMGKTVELVEAVEWESVDESGSLADLVADLNKGAVDLLVILGTNPVLTAPADLDFARALDRKEGAPLRVHLSLHEDETSDLCDWHVNEAHFLEAWSDARAADGTSGIVQPLIAPLYGGKSSHEIVAAVQNKAGVSGHDLVRETWQHRHAGPDFEAWWRRSLHDGVIPHTASVTRSAPSAGPLLPDIGPSDQLELVFRPDPTIWDGRFANNGWLQELPKPITKLTWDNTAQVSPATAARLGVENEDVVELELDGRKVRAPIWIVPGQADETVVVHLGYGRTKAGRVGNGAGFNAYALRTTKAMWSASGLKVTKTGDKQKLSCTQEHDNMEGREPVRVATIDRFRKEPGLFRAHEGHEKEGGASLHAPHAKGDYSWGMVIDLNACTACGACVAACQAENNSPIVGREEVRRGREMHWIRVDRYFEGEPSHPEVHHQPVPCMHCENAPCELVCPVGATTHSDEGLNEMAYNRCVGTRYCSNNCPYKVRRFNFFLFQDFETEVTKLQRNPDVSVRSRGVMEKCTYCVQRIQETRIHAEKEGRKIADGEMRTACQQVCPAEAIVFGDIADPKSAVAKQKSDPRNYGLLEELNTRPRTTYLAKLKNPNPELLDGTGEHEGKSR
ncbi:MAG TPA: TAT-variant-translocated molybdopterin oxidoreductase [Planctomycetota bacterium]|jgi:molybdopterin-containing oxidoreductase family iron-sulfur binding subunit|nr:TAT-variant-translocated molybdopterin oxidoreductase [Planctomycetota bacterium]